MSVGDELSQLNGGGVITEPPRKTVKKMDLEDLGVRVGGIDEKRNAVDKKLSIFDDIMKTMSK